MEIIRALSSLIWGIPTVILLLSFGIYFGIKLRRSKILSVPYVYKNTFGTLGTTAKSKGGGLSPLSALATALGGTVGVGSITGVALSIKLGGAGSVFWIWVCSIIGIFLKYAEVFLAHHRRKRLNDHLIGGAMLCLSDLGFKRTAGIFSAFCVFASFGNATVQSNAVSKSLTALGLQPKISALLIASCILFITLGGREKIARFNSMAVPFFSISFILVCFVILLINIKAFPKALLRIVTEAFGIREAGSGITAGLFLNALKVGTVRGTFSHEAGMGSSAIAHASSSETNSHVQGLWGATEVFIDSFIVSTLTAFCILSSGFDDVGRMFESFFGTVGQIYFTCAIAVFALAAIISWVYYGETALLASKSKKLLIKSFCIITALAVFLGALSDTNVVFIIADLFNGLMIFPNLFLLYKLRSEIVCAGKV